MTRPGITVTTSAVAQAATPGQRLGCWFIAAETERGPLVPDLAHPMRSLADFATIYGTRNTTLGSVSQTYDALDAFWRAGGGPVLLSRVVGPAAVVASLSVVDRAGSPVATVKVSAKGPGVFGNTLKTQITNGVASNTFNVVVLTGTTVLETSPDLGSPTDAVTWSTSSQYVTVTDLASASPAPTNNPAVTASTSLASGADDLTSITDVHWTAALNAIPASYGPGLVSKVGTTTAAGHAGTVAHGAANNRFPILDAPNGASATTLATLATTVAAAATSPEYGFVAAPWLVVPPAVSGPANRQIAPSSIVAGLMSRQVSTGPANVAAAGSNGAAQWVLDVTQTFTDAELDTLNTDGGAVNILRRPYSSSLTPPVELYGYNTLGKAAAGWRQATAQLLRIRLTDELKQLAEAFIFDQIDGRGQKVAEFGAALRGVMQFHFDSGELYGSTPADAYTVDVASVNNATTAAAGQLNARVGFKPSPFAEFVFIDLAKFSVNSSLAA